MFSRDIPSGVQKTNGMSLPTENKTNDLSLSKSNPKRTDTAPTGFKAFLQTLKNLIFPSAEVKAEREMKRAETNFNKSFNTLMKGLSDYTANSKTFYAMKSLISAHETMAKTDNKALFQRVAEMMPNVSNATVEKLQNLGESGLDKMANILKEKGTSFIEGGTSVGLGMDAGGFYDKDDNPTTRMQKQKSDINALNRDLGQIFSAIKSGIS
ncbi:MAG: hypothetical protein R3D90_10300 [Paracoccaceae bacterium]